jgi:hypothetical protein
MSYPKMKYCGLRDDDRCIVRSEEEEAALEGVWADSPAAFYEKIPPGCRKSPKPAIQPVEVEKVAPKPAPVPKPQACALCGEPDHDIKACPEAAQLKG